MEYESNELFEYLKVIADMSFAGEIPWHQPNPSTFQWTHQVENEKYQVVVQKALAPKKMRTHISLNTNISEDKKFTYLFQVVNRTTKQTEISISSAERPEFYEILGNIFSGALKGIDRRSGNILKKLLNHR